MENQKTEYHRIYSELRNLDYFQESERFFPNRKCTISIFAIMDIEKYSCRDVMIPETVFSLFPYLKIFFPMKEKTRRIFYPYYFCLINPDFNSLDVDYFWLYNSASPTLFQKYPLYEFATLSFEEVLENLPERLQEKMLFHLDILRGK